MRAIAYASALVLLLACGQTGPKRPITPAPDVIEVPVRIYVSIPSEFTSRCAWTKTAPPSKVYEVTAGRKRCLLQYERMIDAIKRIEGTPVPESDSLTE